LAGRNGAPIRDVRDEPQRRESRIGDVELRVVERQPLFPPTDRVSLDTLGYGETGAVIPETLSEKGEFHPLDNVAKSIGIVGL